MEIRVLLVDPEKRVTEVLVFATGKPTTKMPPTPEKVDGSAPTSSAAARLVCQGRGKQLTRAIARRLKQLESCAKEVAAAPPEPHSFCFIEPVNKRVTSTLTWENGKQVWTHFDPPRDRAEFEPII